MFNLKCELRNHTKSLVCITMKEIKKSKTKTKPNQIQNRVYAYPHTTKICLSSMNICAANIAKLMNDGKKHGADKIYFEIFFF